MNICREKILLYKRARDEVKEELNRAKERLNRERRILMQKRKRNKLLLERYHAVKASLNRKNKQLQEPKGNCFSDDDTESD